MCRPVRWKRPTFSGSISSSSPLAMPRRSQRGFSKSLTRKWKASSALKSSWLGWASPREANERKSCAVRLHFVIRYWTIDDSNENIGAFRLYDADADGFISRKDLLSVLRAVYRMVGSMVKPSPDDESPEKRVNRIFEMMSVDLDGSLFLRVVIEAFLCWRYVRRDNILRYICAGCQVRTCARRYFEPLQRTRVAKRSDDLFLNCTIKYRPITFSPISDFVMLCSLLVSRIMVQRTNKRSYTRPQASQKRFADVKNASQRDLAASREAGQKLEIEYTPRAVNNR